MTWGGPEMESSLNKHGRVFQPVVLVHSGSENEVCSDGNSSKKPPLVRDAAAAAAFRRPAAGGGVQTFFTCSTTQSLLWDAEPSKDFFY